MKKIKYEQPVGKPSEMIDLYKAKIKEALDERNIAAIYFGNAPATNPNDEDYDDLLTTVTSRKPTIDEAVKLVEKRNKSLIDTGVRTGEIFITNILYSDKGEL